MRFWRWLASPVQDVPRGLYWSLLVVVYYLGFKELFFS